MKLNDKFAVVTGAGRGIGRGCALELARAGATLVLNDRPDSPDLGETAREAAELGAACHVVEADVFSRPGCEQFAQRVLQSVPRVDVLVSNPACSIRQSFLEFDPEDFERVVNGTLVSGFHVSQLFARHMVERGSGGKIIFISSVQAQMAMARSSAYNAAKAGLNHLARTIATELCDHRINVNVIEPGWIDTPGEHQSFGSEVIERESAKLPWARLGTPSDIGRAAAFLASDDADYITGAVLCVDGGFRLKDWRQA